MGRQMKEQDRKAVTETGEHAKGEEKKMKRGGEVESPFTALQAGA